MSHSLWSHGPYSPCNSPGRNTGVGSLFLLQVIFPIQGLNPGLLHCRWILYQLSHKGSPSNEIRPIIYEFLKRRLVNPCTSPYNALILAVCVCVFSCVWLFETPSWTVAYQAPLSMVFSRWEYCNVLLFPSPGDLPNPGIEPRSPAF